MKLFSRKMSLSMVFCIWYVSWREHSALYKPIQFRDLHEMYFLELIAYKGSPQVLNWTSDQNPYSFEVFDKLETMI